MKGYKTHESFWADSKMYFKLFSRAFLVGLIIQLVVIVFGVDKIAKDVSQAHIVNTNIKLPSSVFWKYHFGVDFFGGISVEKEMLKYSLGYTKLPKKVYQILADKVSNNAYKNVAKNFKNLLFYSLFSYIATILYLGAFYISSKTEKIEKFVRGHDITPIDEFNKKLAKEAKKNPLSIIKIGNTHIPFEMESKHMLILGTSGSGKSVLLHQIIAQINERKFTKRTNEKCILYDLKGEFIEKQYNSKLDLIFSPFDKRSVQWNLFNEIEQYPDFDVIAEGLFATDDTKNKYFYDCAKDVFRAGLIFLKQEGRTTNRDIAEFFSKSTEEIVVDFMKLPPHEQTAIKHIDKSDSTTSANIMSLLLERNHFLKYLTDMDGTFSFRKFIRDQALDANGQYIPKPNLFILNVDQYKSIFKPVMTLIINTMIQQTLSLPDDISRRIFFIIDELGSLFRLDSVIDLITVGRSKGASLICANQDLGRIEEAYGRANLKTFYNNFNTNFTFRIREPETAEFLSKAIGEKQIIKVNESRQVSPSDIGDRKSWAEQEKTERLVIPTEFQTLPDLTAIVNIANFGVSKIEVPRIFYKKRYEGFIMKDFPNIGQPEFSESSNANIKEDEPEIISNNVEMPKDDTSKSDVNISSIRSITEALLRDN